MTTEQEEQLTTISQKIIEIIRGGIIWKHGKNVSNDLANLRKLHAEYMKLKFSA